jgi:hypothetical protein
VVREIERIALDTPGIVRVAAFAGYALSQGCGSSP